MALRRGPDPPAARGGLVQQPGQRVVGIGVVPEVAGLDQGPRLVAYLIDFSGTVVDARFVEGSAILSLVMVVLLA